MNLGPLHATDVDGSLSAHLLDAHLLTDVVVGVVIALLLFGLYYRLVLVPAQEKASTRHSKDSPPPGNTGN